MFNTDKPIKSFCDDKLGRGVFSKQLASTIMQFKTKDNYTISLQGKWGSGKTSVVNMVIEEIKHLSQCGEKDEEVVIVQFNPWNFTDNNQLINQFFLTLSGTLKIFDSTKKFEKVGDAIEKYSDALTYSEYIPVVGKYLKLLPKMTKIVGKSIKNNAKSKLNNVTSMKEEVEQTLQEFENRILIVIDDIDRLPNEQIRLIFQLINSVAGFPNVTYLLSFDRDIVSRALSDVQHCDGQEYLEKIIQVPFDIPPINKDTLNTILFKKLDELVETREGMDFDSDHWNSVFDSCVKPYINTLRDVNRFYNVFSFMYAGVKREVDFIDMAGICSLRLFANNIYEWIRKNRYFLVGGYSFTGKSVNDAEQEENRLIESFEKVNPQDPHGMLNAVVSLFPKVKSRISFSYSNQMETNEVIHQAMRIASEGKFDLYFSLSLENVKIGSDEIDDSIFRMDETTLREYIITLKEKNKFETYLNEIQHNLTRIPDDRIELILSVVLFENGRIYDESQKLLGIRSADVSIYVVERFLMQIKVEPKRFEYIWNMFNNTDFLSFQELLQLMHIIELSYGRIAQSEHMHDEKLITPEHLNKIETVFMQRIEEFSVNNNILDAKECRRIIMLWEFIVPEKYSKYISKLLFDELNAIKLLFLYMTIWRSNEKRSMYELTDRSYEKYIKSEQLLRIIESNRMIEAFWKLSEEKIEAAAAFTLIMKSETRRNEVEIVDIIAKISEWKKDIADLQ